MYEIVSAWLNLETAMFLFSAIATITLAVTGVTQAARHEFDPFGALVLACVTALGGGTLRDLLLGATPVFWVEDLSYLLFIIPTAIITMLSIRRIVPGHGVRLRIIALFDAAGLALFCLLGVQKALAFGFHEIIAVVMGVVTGVAGGMMRDVLCQIKPAVLYEDVYATCAIVGGIVYTTTLYWFPYLDRVMVMLFSMAVIFIMRVMVILGRWSIPRLSL